MNRRFVIDTGVLVSALLRPQSIPRQAVDLAMELGDIVVTHATMGELAEVLGRERFDRFVALSLRQAFVAQLGAAAELVTIIEEVRACRDPKDDMFLSLAVSAGAECVVSGDEDLLVLHPFRSIPIVTPRNFLLMYSPK